MLTIVYTGCATSQLIDITSEPSKVAVSVDEEFIGKTPVSYEIEDVADFDSLRIVVDSNEERDLNVGSNVVLTNQTIVAVSGDLDAFDREVHFLDSVHDGNDPHTHS